MGLTVIIMVPIVYNVRGDGGCIGPGYVDTLSIEIYHHHLSAQAFKIRAPHPVINLQCLTKYPVEIRLDQLKGSGQEIVLYMGM